MASVMSRLFKLSRDRSFRADAVLGEDCVWAGAKTVPQWRDCDIV